MVPSCTNAAQEEILFVDISSCKYFLDRGKYFLDKLTEVDIGVFGVCAMLYS